MSNASEPEESVNSCARCRRDATQTCNGCYQAPDAYGERVETTWYCSSDCQIKDRSRHKFACSAAQGRKSLYRAGATAQLAFYRYREKFFDLGISRVEKKGSDLYLYEGGPNEMDELPLSWESFSNEEDKLSGLTYLTCGNSLGFVHVLMEIMLPGEFERRYIELRSFSALF